MNIIPVFSIITINLDNLEGLKKTINSVINQTEKRFEIIIIDGGSSDGSKEYINSNNNQINYWISEKDNGIFHAMNKGIEKASGNYFMFLNSGDYLISENTLELITQKISLSADTIYYGDIIELGQTKTKSKEFPKNIDLYFLYQRGLCHQAILYPKEIFNKYNYREDLKYKSDWLFNLTLYINGYVFYKLDFKLVYYQMGGLTNSIEGRIKAKNEFVDLSRNELKNIDFEISMDKKISYHLRWIHFLVLQKIQNIKLLFVNRILNFTKGIYKSVKIK